MGGLFEVMMPPAKKPSTPRRKAAPTTNAGAVAELLSTLGVVDVALANLAVTLARSLDDGAGMATAAVARELRATLTELRESAAATEETISKADQLRARRQARIAGAEG
jgi:hypothetical protein